MLVCTVPEHLDAPTPRGFSVVDGDWRLDASHYRDFLTTVVGDPPPYDCGDDDCYLVGSRLEGFVEQRRAHDEWTDDLPARYPDVTSLAEIEAMALFFRTCEADWQPARSADGIPL